MFLPALVSRHQPSPPSHEPCSCKLLVMADTHALPSHAGRDKNTNKSSWQCRKHPDGSKEVLRKGKEPQ